jgi:hypothetical protein
VHVPHVEGPQARPGEEACALIQELDGQLGLASVSAAHGAYNEGTRRWTSALTWMLLVSIRSLHIECAGVLCSRLARVLPPTDHLGRCQTFCRS